MTKPPRNPLAVSIEQRMQAIAPFYYAYAVRGLPRSQTFCALQSTLTGLIRLECTDLVPVPAPSTGLRLVFDLPIHPNLFDVVESDAREIIASRHIEGPWYDIRGQDGDDLAYCFSETAYLEMVHRHMGKLLPRVPADDPTRWFVEMDAHLRAAESWLLANEASQILERNAGGITRRTFRPGQAPLIEYLTVSRSHSPRRSKRADPSQMQLSLAPDETPTSRQQQQQRNEQLQPAPRPVLPEPRVAGPATANRRTAAASASDHPPRRRVQKGGGVSPSIPPPSASSSAIPPKGFGCARSPQGYNSVSVVDLLRPLKVGDSVVVPRSRVNSVGGAARRLGIRVECRRLGQKDTTTIFRVL